MYFSLQTPFLPSAHLIRVSGVPYTLKSQKGPIPTKRVAIALSDNYCHYSRAHNMLGVKQSFVTIHKFIMSAKTFQNLS